MSSLTGCTALVTGASSGIGKAIALALAAQGVDLCLIGRNRDALDGVSQAAQAQGIRATVYPLDLERDEDIRQLKAQLEHDSRPVDILIHSAGILITGRWNESRIEDFDRQYYINVRAPYLLTQTLLPELIERQGQIVFVNSTAGKNARGGVGQYAATKHALLALADSLREEVNPLGVRVLTVYPGRTASPMQAALFAEEGREYRPERLLQPEDVAAAVVNALLLPKTAEVTDLHIRPFQKA